MFWNNSRTFYNLSETLGSFGFLPLRGAGTGFVVVLPLPLIFDPPLYILHFTIYIHYISQRRYAKKCIRITELQRQDSKPSAWTITRVFSLKINHRVNQIRKEGEVVNRRLTARRHFWTPWSERTHCMENGQSVFSLSPSLRSKRFRAVSEQRTRNESQRPREKWRK